MRFALFAILTLCLVGCGTKEQAKPLPTTAVAQSLYDIEVETAEGTKTTLADYKGKTLLIVNVASNCGYTGQYEALQALYKTYKARNFEILAFPSNDFGGQEPESIDKIKEFCQSKYSVTFPLFNKLHAGDEKQLHPLYQFLTTKATPNGPINWNFEKFLINPNGEIVARFASQIRPDADLLVKAVEQTTKGAAN